jgi:hypothetical protein
MHLKCIGKCKDVGASSRVQKMVKSQIEFRRAGLRLLQQRRAPERTQHDPVHNFKVPAWSQPAAVQRGPPGLQKCTVMTVTTCMHTESRLEPVTRTRRVLCMQPSAARSCTHPTPCGPAVSQSHGIFLHGWRVKLPPGHDRHMRCS